MSLRNTYITFLFLYTNLFVILAKILNAITDLKDVDFKNINKIDLENNLIESLENIDLKKSNIFI